VGYGKSGVSHFGGMPPTARMLHCVEPFVGDMSPSGCTVASGVVGVGVVVTIIAGVCNRF